MSVSPSTAAPVDLALAQKVLALLDQGLVKGKGQPKPGKMCVEAAICYAMGLPHGDQPACVSAALRQLKIRLNDANWFSNQSRAAGLRRLALVQLGSAGALDECEFAKRLSRLAIQLAVPQALRAAANTRGNSAHKDPLLHWADICEQSPTEQNAREAKSAATAAAAYAAAADAAADGARDKSLAAFCEAVVQILIEMKVPGVQWLYLVPEAS